MPQAPEKSSHRLLRRGTAASSRCRRSLSSPRSGSFRDSHRRSPQRSDEAGLRLTTLDTARASRIAPGRTAIFAGLFVMSGACALTYQVVWSRLLAEIFGVTAFAVSTVLVSFMGGMALGAYWLGTRVDRSARPLRIFALLEAGIGAYGLLLPLLLAAA